MSGETPLRPASLLILAVLAGHGIDTRNYDRYCAAVKYNNNIRPPEGNHGIPGLLLEHFTVTAALYL